MSANLAVRLWPETLRTLAHGSISGTYAGIGTAISNPTRIYLIQNFTDVQMFFSWDGINDHMTLSSGGFILLDVTMNRSNVGGSLNIAEGTRVYVRNGTDSPTLGGVYLSVFYGQGALT